MKSREYCCCAIPLTNSGIYFTLIEQFALGMLVGILALATPSIVGAATPSFAPVLLAVDSFAAAGVQVLGFMGVIREKVILYRRYVSLHGLATSAAFSIAAAWIIVSATRHSTAKAKCIDDFFSDLNSDLQTQGDTLCGIFPWVDVGIMGGLWAILAILHIYLYIVVSSYSTSQQRDHEKYDQLNDSMPLTSENIPLANRNDPWDSRPSTDSVHAADRRYDHVRQESATSVSDVMNQPYQQPKEDYSNHGYDNTSYPPQSQGGLARYGSQGNSLSHPAHAYTQDPGPTPQYSDSFYGGPSNQFDRPPNSYTHPAEGSFRRKTPRI